MRTNTFKLFGMAGLVAVVLASCAEVPAEAKKGCMNPEAVNYDAEATEDAGGCVTIQQKQYSLFFKYTATWCHYCGEWGGEAFESVYNAEKGKMLAFSVQVDDDFANPSNSAVESAFSSKWVSSGVPAFVSNETVLASYTTAGSTFQARNSNSPVAGIGLHYTVGAGANTGKLNINAYTKFFQQASGDYYLAIYILHKNIVKSQNVSGTYVDDYMHHHVLVSAVTEPWGNKVTTNAAPGQVFNQQYVFPYTGIPELKLSAMEVVGVLFKKSGTSYEVVNVTPN